MTMLQFLYLLKPISRVLNAFFGVLVAPVRG